VGREQRRPWKYLLFLLAALALFLNGCSTIEPLRTLDLKSELREADSAHQQGRYNRALQLYTSVLEASGNQQPADLALYRLGILYIDPGNPSADIKTALDYLGRLVKEFPESRYALDARVLTAKLKDLEKLRRTLWVYSEIKPYQYFRYTGSFRQTLKRYSEVLQEGAEKPLSDLALFNLGILYVYSERERNFNKALGYFKRLIKEFPESSRIDEARAWVKTLEIILKLSRIEVEMEKKKKELIE